MPKPYSYDLRCKVIEAIELDGMPINEAVEVFHISRSTIHLWRCRKAETGDVQAKENPHPGHSHKITDWSKFRAFMKAHSDKIQTELAELWDGDISDRTIGRGIEKIGFTRKKNLRIRRTR
jgi:transposase